MDKYSLKGAGKRWCIKPMVAVKISVLGFLTAGLLACGGGSGSDDLMSDSGVNPDGQPVVPPVLPPVVDPQGGGMSGDGESPENQFTITVVAGEGGGATVQALNAAAGSRPVITLLPAAGFTLQQVTGCAGTLQGSDYQLQPVQRDCTVNAFFSGDMAMLNIAVFGEGSVSVPGLSACASRSLCQYELTAGTNVVLSAQPAPGWRFSHWRNCDSDRVEQCSLSVSDEHSVYPTFKRIEPVTLQSDVVELNEAQLDALLEITDSGLVFAATATEIITLPVNSVLVSTRGDGFARRVTRIVASAGSPILVQTRQATLEDVVSAGTLVWNGDDEAGKQAYFVPREGVRLIAGAQQKGLTQSLQVDFSLAENLTLSGQVQLQFEPDFAIDVGLLRGIEEIKAAAGLSISASVGLVGEVNGALIDKTGSNAIELGHFVLAPVVFPGVVIIPTVTVLMDIQSGAAGAVEVGISYSVAGVAGTHYRRGFGWRSINALANSWSAPDITGATSLYFKAWARPAAAFRLYGLAGPVVEAGPNLSVKVGTENLFPFERICFSGSYAVGVKGRVGASQISLFGRAVPVPDYTISAVPLQFALENVPQLDPACEQIIYAAPNNVTADLTDAGAVLVGWEPPPGQPLFNYTVERDGSLLANVFDGTEYLDSAVQPNQRYCYQIRASDDVGKQSATSPQVCVDTRAPLQDGSPASPSGLVVTGITTNSMSLGWDEVQPADGIAYGVMQNGVLLFAVTDAMTNVTQLLPDTEYCFSVFAYDRGGNQSTPATRVCATTLPELSGQWRMRIKCANRINYVLESQIDLSVADNGLVNVAGQGVDYTGEGIAYIVSGAYEAASQTLNGNIVYTFSILPDIREDLFSAVLSGNDTGDISMQQVRITGCETEVRFDQPNRITKRFAEITNFGSARELFEHPRY